MEASITTALRDRIETEHRAAHAAARTAISHAVECGRLLTEAKKQVGYGQWLQWVRGNLSFGPRRAQKYIQLRRADTTCKSHLPIDTALVALREEKERARPAPAGTADLSAKRQLIRRRTEAIERLTVKMQDVAGRFGAAAVAEAQSAYRPSFGSRLIDAVPLQPAAPLVGSKPTVVPLRTAPASTPTVDAVEAEYLRMTSGDQDELVRRLLEHQRLRRSST